MKELVLGKEEHPNFDETIVWLNRLAVTGYRLVAGVRSFHLLTGHGGNFWGLIQNSVGEASILYWSHLFLDRDDELYYKKFFSRPEIQALGDKFTSESVKKRLLAAIRMSEDAYSTFWMSIKTFRDRWIAHKDFSDVEKIDVFPDLNVCMAMGEELRCILRDVCEAGATADLHPEFGSWLAHFDRAWPNSGIHAEIKRLWEQREKYIRR